MCTQGTSKEVDLSQDENIILGGLNPHELTGTNH